MKRKKSPKKSSKPSTGSSKGVEWIGTNLKGKRVELIHRGRLNFYSSARWSNPSGTFGYGEGWKVDIKYMVDGYPMYRVQNSKGKLFFITASSKFLKVVKSMIIRFNK